MKVLRLFAIRHYGLYAVLKNGNESRWKQQPMHRDYPDTMKPETARIRLMDELGWPPELHETKYPPDHFVRIQNHTICEDTPQRGVIETFRATEMDLLSPTDLKNAQGEKTKLK